MYRGAEYVVESLAKVKIEIIVSNQHYMDKPIGATVKNVKTGKIGDGKIFVSDIARTI